MKKQTITSKIILGVVAIAVIVVVGIVIFGKGSHGALGASVFNATVATTQTAPVTSTPPAITGTVVGIGTRTLCISSGALRTPPSITITSPNGGEVYTAGQQITVTWTSCNIPTGTHGAVFLYMPSIQQGVNIGSVLISTGSATRTLPTSWSQMVYGTNFKIDLLASTGTVDYSDNLFTINHSQLAITSPNSGTFYQGQTIPITWSGGDSSLPIQLWLATTGNNAQQTSIVNMPYGNGSYNWTIPTWANGQYRISILENNSQNPWDYNYGGTFTIASGVPIQVSPNGTPTAVVAAMTSGQQHQVITFSIPFSVTAGGQSAYIPAHVAGATSAVAANVVQYAIDSGGPNLGITQSGTLAEIGSYTMNTNGNYLIPAGATENFVLTATYQIPTAGSYRASLINVNWNTNNSAAIYNTYTTGLSSITYSTPYVVGQ